jgi:hypothetical protein
MVQHYAFVGFLPLQKNTWQLSLTVLAHEYLSVVWKLKEQRNSASLWLTSQWVAAGKPN